MEKETSKTTLERRLAVTEEQIKRRIDGLENEIVSTPAAIRDAIRKNPWVGVGAAVAAGAVVGVIFGRKRKKSSVPPAHQALIEGYISAVADDVRRGIKRGKDPEDVVRKSLHEKTPVIVYTPNDVTARASQQVGMMRQVADLALKTALGFAVKTAIDFLTASLDVKKLQSMLLLEEEQERRSTDESAAAPAGAAMPDAVPLRNTPVDH